MRDDARRLPLVIAGLVVALAVAGLWGRADRNVTAPRERPPAAPPIAPAVDEHAATAADGPDGAADLERMLAGDPLAGAGDPGAAWAKVDLDAVRKEMPDNLYWKMALPTQDPAILEMRKEERTRWNVEYGKVLSNTATAEEIDAYYAHLQLLSSDYLEFVVHVLTHYGDVIPKRDAGLLKLAGEMHLARIEEIPRKQAEAHERHAAHEQARRAWLAEQKAFASDDGATP
jgi:hypothetical protein